METPSIEAEIKIASNLDLEELLISIGSNAAEIKGRGFYNKADNVVGITLYPDGKMDQIIDIFLKLPETLSLKSTTF